MKDVYVTLKIRPEIWGRKPDIRALAYGTKAEMESLKEKIESRNAKRNYSVSYYISVVRIG